MISPAVDFSIDRLHHALPTVCDRLCNLPALRLSPDSLNSINFAIEHYPVLNSTNTQLWQWVDANCAAKLQTDSPESQFRSPHLIPAAIASQQHTGRGQWGRTWVSPLGGLYLSLALAPAIPTQHSAHLTLASGWGIATVLRAFGVPVQLKWPNDLVLMGRKLGGILTETRVHGEQISWAVVGVGINWNNPVPDIGIALQPWLAAQGHGEIQSLEELAAIALYGIAVGDRVRQQHGMTAIVPDYETLLIHRGRTISLPAATGGGSGVIVGIASNGALRVHIPDLQQTVQIHPGMISLGYDTERSSDTASF